MLSDRLHRITHRIARAAPVALGRRVERASLSEDIGAADFLAARHRLAQAVVIALDRAERMAAAGKRREAEAWRRIGQVLVRRHLPRPAYYWRNMYL